MDRTLTVAGAVLMAIGLVMIPLPGPGFVVLGLGLLVLVAGTAVWVSGRGASDRMPRKRV